MKKALLYLLLLCYTTVILKPVMPSLSDMVAHIFWYSHHMATVHYEHGKYHVHYDYMQAAKRETGDKNTGILKLFSSENEHLVLRDAPPAVFYISLPLHTHRWVFFLPDGNTCNDYPPPKHTA